jgi:hypothetical protein
MNNKNDFKDLINILNCPDTTGDTVRVQTLEEFLISLWELAQEKHNQNPHTARFVLNLLCNALHHEPGNYDPAWKDIPFPMDVEKKFPVDVEDPADEKLLSDFEYFRHMILYQIADLHMMREKGIYEWDGNALFIAGGPGRKSPWYNMFIEDYVITGFNPKHLQQYEEDCTWREFGNSLWVGQIYE